MYCQFCSVVICTDGAAQCRYLAVVCIVLLVDLAWLLQYFGGYFNTYIFVGGHHI